MPEVKNDPMAFGNWTVIQTVRLDDGKQAICFVPAVSQASEELAAESRP
jgi:hypothetical protein